MKLELAATFCAQCKISRFRGIVSLTATYRNGSDGRRVPEKKQHNGHCMPFSEGSFDPETLTLMTNALQEALHELEFGGATSAINVNMDYLKNTMALRIMSAVRMGERDPTRLRLMALNAIDGRKPE